MNISQFTPKGYSYSHTADINSDNKIQSTQNQDNSRSNTHLDNIQITKVEPKLFKITETNETLDTIKMHIQQLCKKKSNYSNALFQKKDINYLSLAIECNADINLIEKLLQCGWHPDTRFNIWETPPLHIAIEKKNITIVKMLLDFKANPNIIENSMNFVTPLSVATLIDDRNFFELLISYGADVNFKIKQNFYTPLVQAVYHNKFELMEYMLSNGANVNGCVDKDTKTPLHHASCTRKGFSRALEILLKHGADANLPDKEPPLLEAIERGNELSVILLLKKGAKVNIKYKDLYDGFPVTSPLFHAVNHRHIRIIKILLEFGANPNIEMHDKKPIDIAIEKHDINVAYLLRSYNAVADDKTIEKIVNSYGHDPYDISLRHITALCITKYYHLETNPEIINKLPLPMSLKKALKNKEI